MKIVRIDNYTDKRFSSVVLQQHGAFEVDGKPYACEIISGYQAKVYGEDAGYYDAVIDEFRFYAEHITEFYDKEEKLVKTFPPVLRFPVQLSSIQPSQFYVDKEKMSHVSTFVDTEKDIVIPLLPYEDRYISLDGHTRMAVAVSRGYREVWGFVTTSDAYIFDFVKEAKQRGVYTPFDIQVVDHDAYQVRWNAFCDAYWKQH